MHLRTTFLWIMVGSLSLAAALGVVVIIFEQNFGRFGERALATSLLVGGFSLVCLACAIVLDRKVLRGLMWAGVATSLAALAMWLGMVWVEPYIYAEEVAKSAGTLTIACIWIAHVGMLSLLPLRRPAWRVLRLVTIALAAALALLINGVMWTESFEDWAGKSLAVLSILVSCGTVVTPVLSLIEHLRMKQHPRALGKKIFVSLTCPRCGEGQKLAAGKARCGSCGLRINIEVEEPLCECGYLLYELTGDHCPECGREIPETARWIDVSNASVSAQPVDLSAPTS